MRKITCLILSLVFMLIPILSLAYFQDEQIPTWSDSIETISQIQNKTTLELDSESAILLDEDSGTILYAKNEHARLRPASVTKVMTLLLVM